jgi:hypothetical protein
MKLECGERLMLKALKDIQGDTNDYVDDARLAVATTMIVDDVRDLLEMLHGKEFVERTRLDEGFSAYITAKGRQALRLTEPVPTPTQVGEAGPRTEALVAKLEEYLFEDRLRAKLDRLIRETTDAAYQASLELHGQGRQLARTADSFAEWLASYDSMAQPLLSLLVFGCRWGEARHIELWVRCIDRMAGILGEGLAITAGLDLRSYPATLLLYGGGLASVAAGRYDTLHALLEKAEVRRWGELTLPAALVLHGPARSIAPDWSYSLDNFMGRLPELERRYTPTSDHIHEVLREPMKGIEPDDYRYDLLFDRFECLLAMTAGHLQFGPVKRHPSIAEARPSLPLLGIPMPAGRFGWRRNNHPDMLGSLKAEQSGAGANWPPLAAGMFGGDVQRFQGLVGSLESRVRENDWR